MFNTTYFKNKLEFTIIQLDKIYYEIQKNNSQQSTKALIDKIWQTSLIVLWQTRHQDNAIVFGIDNEEDFETFTKYLNVMIQQFFDDVIYINKEYDNNLPKLLLNYNKLLKEIVNDVTVELDEYFLTNIKK